MGQSILLVEDDNRFADFLCGFLRKNGADVDVAPTGEEGLVLYETKSPDIVILDLGLPGMDGLSTLEQLKAIDDTAAVIVMTADASIATAVEAMRLGAIDFATKPVDLEALTLKLEQARALLGLRSDLGYLLDREQRQSHFENIIGDCARMKDVYEKIRQVAQTDNSTVLITGPSGTGKELVARAIHSLSSRRRRPLIQIDCTSIPISLMESELFGHERGAFTSADVKKKGLLELADDGTLFLDEVGDMDQQVQGKFLRVLQERTFRRVGGTRDMRFDVRVIAATNQDLEQRCNAGLFRSDLMYRLKVFQIELPPLVDRGRDILLLADAFVAEFARSFRKPVRGLDEGAKAALMGYDFPGNVRELRNIIEQAVILAGEDVVTAAVLSIPEKGASARRSARMPTDDSLPLLSLDALGDSPLEAAELELIKQALERENGNKKRAAERLGISRFALQRKLEKLALKKLTSGDSLDL